MKILMGQISDAATTASPHGTYLGQSDTGDLLISTIDGAISVSQLQPAGKKSMPARDFLNGKTLVIGQSIHDQL